MKQKVSIKTLYLIGIIGAGLILLAIGSTYAMFTASIVIDNPISLSSSLSSTSEVIETVDVLVESGEVKTVRLYVSNTTNTDLKYGSWYVSDNDDIIVGVSSDSNDPPVGTILREGSVSTSGSDTKIVTVVVKNTSSFSANVSLGVSASEDSIVISDEWTPIIDVINSSDGSYTVSIKVKFGDLVSDVYTQTVLSGASVSPVAISGNSSYPLYLGTTCTNSQNANVNVSSSGSVEQVSIGLNSVSSDTVCIVSFYTGSYVVRLDVNYSGGEFIENYLTQAVANGNNFNASVTNKYPGTYHYCNTKCTNGQNAVVTNLDPDANPINYSFPVTDHTVCTVNFSTDYCFY